MNKFLAGFFIFIASPGFSQVEEFFDELKGTSIDMYERVDSIRQIPEEMLTSLEKRLPNRRKMPLLSVSEYITSVKSVKDFIKKHRPRIFQSAFKYKRYLMIDYYININTYAVRSRVVARLNDNEQVDMIIFMRQADVSDRKNFGRFKRLGKQMYLDVILDDDKMY